MPKNQMKRKSRRLFKRRNTSDPSFTHVLTYDFFTNGSSSNPALLNEVFFNNFSGFPQLASFFEMVQPISYRLRCSYTGWSGSAAYVPQNPLSIAIPSTSSNLDEAALMEVRGSVRLQAGYNNTGAWCRYPYATIGFQTYQLNLTSTSAAGYLAFFNDNPSLSTVWPVQMTLDVKMRFFRRTLYYFTVTPSLTPTFITVQNEMKRVADKQALTERGTITTIKTSPTESYDGDLQYNQ
jgi:hypothetical protein